MTGKLAGKRALVTGAASGIGKSIAESYAREGAVVAVQARSIERSAETLESITAEGGEAFAVAADLTDTGEIEAMCQQAIERLGGIDIVMNNAGVGEYKKVVDMEESFWDRIMDVNLKAPFLVSKYTLPAMIEQGAGGVQLFNASTNAKTADADWTAYNATKHGLVGFVRCLAAEVGPQGIRVNAICPGWIDTKMAVELHEDFAREMKEPYEKVYDESMRLNMLSEIIPPQAVADMAVFLAGEGGTYVTGQAINVCAGLSVH
ncbi:MAG: putative ketoacyl reductase [Alphaproteobacteria bacterium MarineAlpha10_Bin2]|nr:MAG: putative ketoacyl reductase [Alphaproteobacteria bacterium MarineAlpha10_Bin2]